MARSRQPEKTYERILDVSLELFSKKGYEKTSINDILASLGDLTKGAIYHHFKSKEDILIAVVNRICDYNIAEAASIVNRKDLSAKQRIEMLYDNSLKSKKQETLFSITPNLLDNPTFLAQYIKTMYSSIIPEYFIPLLRQGVEDGSIQTDYPDQLAELILFLSDIWLNPLIFQMTSDIIAKKALLFNQLMLPFGLKILSDDAIKRLKSFSAFSKNNKGAQYE